MADVGWKLVKMGMNGWNGGQWLKIVQNILESIKMLTIIESAWLCKIFTVCTNIDWK